MAPFRPSLQQLRILIGLWKDITPFWTIWETYSPPQTVTYDFYCTEAKHNKSTNNPWYLIIQVTHVYNCLETCRKTLKRCWFFFFLVGWLGCFWWWQMNYEYRAACFGFQQKQRWSAESGPSQTDSGWFKGPCQGLVYERDLLHCMLVLLRTDLVMLWDSAFAGRKAFCTMLWYHGAPNWDLLSVACEVKMWQYNPLIWYHVQHKPVGLLVPTRTSFF